MSLSRSLSVMTGLVCAAAFIPRAAAAQDPRVDWLFDLNYNAASRMGASADCEELHAQARSNGGTASCAVDKKMPAWSASGGVMFFRRLGVKIGYLDYRKIELHANASASGSFGPPPGMPGPMITYDSTFREDSEFGRARGVTLVGLVRVPVGRVVPFGEAGLWRWSADSLERRQFSLSVGGVALDAGSYDDHRRHSSWDPMLGGGAEVWLNGMIALNGGVRLVRLRTPDRMVDEQFTTVFLGAKIARR